MFADFIHSQKPYVVTNPAGTDDARFISDKNPFGMADKSSVDAVIFDGGYGTDYVSFAATLMEKNHAGSSVKVSPTTKIATELQLTKSGLTNTLQRLEARRLIAVEPSPSDGRRKRVTP